MKHDERETINMYDMDDVLDRLKKRKKEVSEEDAKIAIKNYFLKHKTKKLNTELKVNDGNTFIQIVPSSGSIKAE